MQNLYVFLAHELKRRNIRLSKRRLKVLEYLCKHTNHPTVDQIYTSILEDMPGLSKTTIYNTLHLLMETGLVRAINIEDNETRYDITTENHGHFKCQQCSEIFNFTVDFNGLAVDELAGFKVVDKNVYFKGVCPRCLSNIDNKN